MYVETKEINFDDWFKLRMQVDQLVKANDTTQLCFTNTADSEPDLTQGAGSIKYIVDFEKGKSARPDALNEEDFTVFNPNYYNTPIHEIYQLLTEQYTIGRFRIMVSKPKSCLSWHHDEHLRIHVPVVTNDNAYMMFEDMSVHHLPVGRAYVTDTRVHHTAFNAGLHTRIHLLGVIIDG